MKLAIICGALEPGQDGVGDYTRRLAGELVRRNHQVVTISLNDNYVKQFTEETQYADGTAITAMRLPKAMEEADRYKKLNAYLKAFNPGWVSLQYVPFSFHPKGLAYSLSKELVKLKDAYKWHIMFHELWVGVNGTSSTKMALLKFLQRRLIKSFVNRFKADCITTSIPLYQQQFATGKLQLLPLFSNIPVCHNNDVQVSETSQQWFTGVHFGSFSGAVSDFEKQIRYLEKAAKAFNLPFRLVTMGNGGTHKTRSLQIAADVLGAGAIIEKGYLTNEEISAELIKAQIGISRADVLFYGKSGSTMAMLEHGLPVLLRGDSEPAISGINRNELYQDRLCFVNSNTTQLPVKQNTENALSKITDQFLQLLAKHGNII
ncbi:hypothetical protein [Mucilaginibacter lacusdianchii]|uniref:hypothetical protein n=1 Tax=Mucilaginibacter lacusdianchii TaxID=2684211 RepID=UPI00131A93BF|nr:hypothetical protein [Mucilaginibacter sp. JXJ CY 39]